MIGQAIRRASESRAVWTVGGHPRDPVLVKILGTQNRSLSGISITRDSVLRCPAYWKGVGLISDSLAQLPVRVYRYLTDEPSDGSELDRQHPAFSLLRKSPADVDRMTPFVWKQTMQNHALVEGNGYSYIFRDSKTFAPTSLVPLSPDKTYPVRLDGILWYITHIRTPDGGSEIRKLYPDNVLHIKGMGFDGLQGYPILDVGRDVLGRALASQDLGCKFFANGSTSNGILMVPAGIDEQELMNLRESWDRLYSGMDNACKIMLLEEGYKFEKTTIPPDEAQFNETEEMMLTHVANLLRIPPHKLGAKGSSSYNSLEQEDKAFLNECLNPWLVNWEEELELKLLTTEENESDSHYIAFDRSQIAQADTKAQMDTFHLALQDGVVNRDEVRVRLFRMNPIPGGAGQQFLQAKNMGAAGGDPNDPASAKTVDTNTDTEAVATTQPGQADIVAERMQKARVAHQALFRDVVGRVVTRLAKSGKRAAKDRHKFKAWLDGMEEEHRAVVDDMLSPVIAACAAIAGREVNGDVVELRKAIIAALIGSCTEASGRCTEKDLETTIGRELDRWERRESPLLLELETHSLAGV